MQMEGAGRGRRDSEPRKSGGTPYKNYWGPFPGRTAKAPETAAAPGSSERGGGRRGAASAPVGARRAAQAAALQVGSLPLPCSTAWPGSGGIFLPPPFFFFFLVLLNILNRCVLSSFPLAEAVGTVRRCGVAAGGAELRRWVSAAADRSLFLLFC